MARPIRLVLVLLLSAATALSASCRGGEPPQRPDWVVVIHGGAGVISRDIDPEERQSHLDGLERALGVGVEILDGGGSALDAVEAVIRVMEDDPQFNAGRGAVFNHDGGHELDASIMDGSSLACGAVAAVRTVKHPITLARRVMEDTPHVLLAADGAERFADEVGVERADPDYFFTQRRWDALQRARAREAEPADRGTVGVVALDRRGDLAAGTSTGGLTNKRFGRVGDSPIIGAGTYADNRSCAVSATGKGEQFIRHGVARSIAMRVEQGLPLAEAAREVIHGRLEPGDGGIIAVDGRGEVAMEFNSQGMYRGAADAEGRFEVHIWE